MKRVFRLQVLFAALIVVSCTITPQDSKPPETTVSQGEGFAIYLTARDVPVSQMEALSYVEPAAEPAISLKDVVSYTWETHEIELTYEAIEKLKSIAVPMGGRSFVVCVDRQPVYWGAFWNSLSSFYPAGIVISYIYPFPLFTDNPHAIRLHLNIPSGATVSALPYAGIDPRRDPAIKGSLEQAGKLR